MALTVPQTQHQGPAACALWAVHAPAVVQMSAGGTMPTPPALIITRPETTSATAHKVLWSSCYEVQRLTLILETVLRGEGTLLNQHMQHWEQVGVRLEKLVWRRN